MGKPCLYMFGRKTDQEGLLMIDQSTIHNLPGPRL
jgi:hypothetical protein